jgi:hypothetical protein
VKVLKKGTGLYQGWIRYQSTSDNFSLDVPDSWLKLELTGGEIEASLGMMKEANPDLGEFLDKNSFRSQLESLVSSGVKLMLYDTKADVSASRFATNLNVLRMEVPSGMSLNEVVEENLAEVRSVIGSGLLNDLGEEEVTLGQTPAYKLSYSYRMNMPDGSFQSAVLIQYILLGGNSEYILTFTTTGLEAGMRYDTFEAIAETFRVHK